MLSETLRFGNATNKKFKAKSSFLASKVSGKSIVYVRKPWLWPMELKIGTELALCMPLMKWVVVRLGFALFPLWALAKSSKYDESR